MSAGPETRAARAGIGSETQHGAVIPPIHLSSTFTFDGFDGKREYDYTRSGNPTRDVLGRAIAELEEGHGAVVTASGMAAVLLVAQLLEPDNLLVAPHDCYGGTYRLLRALAGRGAFRLELLDQTTSGAAARVAALAPRLIWVETPSNPLLRITDIGAMAEAAGAAGALLAVDNTFLSPALQRPIPLGADLVVHSTTKYLNGHSDVVGGAVVARDAELTERLTWWANCLGITGAPFDSYLTLRGLRTLHARMAVHERNAAALVDALDAHPAVRRVHYPGRDGHPGRDIARRQQSGSGAMVSFELRGGERAVRVFLDGLRHFSLAESLGGVESLVAHPATMTHASMDAPARAEAGIRDGLLRLSVGIECEHDLVEDISRGLERAAAMSAPEGAEPRLEEAAHV